MYQGIIFAIITAFALGLWTVFHQKASEYIDPLLGAIIVSFSAVILGILLLLPRIKAVNFHSNSKGFLFVILAGISALAIDFFALKAYGAGLPVSVGGPIIIAGSIAVAVIIGYFFGESVTLLKMSAIFLIILGSVLLSILHK